MLVIVKLKLDALDDGIIVSPLNVFVLTYEQEMEGLEVLLQATDPETKVPDVYEFCHFVGK